MSLELYIDGSCLGNPGRGGYGVVVLRDARLAMVVYSGTPSTTNNQMELRAMQKALEIVEQYSKTCVETNTYANSPPQRNQIARIHCDSTYVINGTTQWVDKWAKAGWVKSSNKREAVANQQQWMKIKAIYDRVKHHTNIIKVKAHSGHQWNDLADVYAKRGAISNNCVCRECDPENGRIGVTKRYTTSTSTSCGGGGCVFELCFMCDKVLSIVSPSDSH